MRVLVFTLIVVSAALFGTPAGAHVVQATTSVSIADIDIEDRPQLEQAMTTAVNQVIKDTIAFRPTFVTLTDAQVIGQRLYFRVLLADEEGERTIEELNRAERLREPRERPARVNSTL